MSARRRLATFLAAHSQAHRSLAVKVNGYGSAAWSSNGDALLTVGDLRALAESITLASPLNPLGEDLTGYLANPQAFRDGERRALDALLAYLLDVLPDETISRSRDQGRGAAHVRANLITYVEALREEVGTE